MRLSLVGAFGAAVVYGIGTVLQAVGARRAAGDGSTGIDTGFLVRLSRQWMYLVGLGCDALGFLLSFAALQDQPLFVVQAAVASSLAVTAVVAAPRSTPGSRPPTSRAWWPSAGAWPCWASRRAATARRSPR